MEAGEGGHHVGHELRQRRSGELVDHPDRLAVARVDLGELDRRQERGEDPGDDHQDQEEDCRIGQLVAHDFDPVEDSVEPALLRGGVGLRCRFS